jgi:hypothetical protein
VDPVFDFCIGQGLLDRSTAEFLTCQYERGHFDPIAEVIASGVGEEGLYRAAAAFYKVRLLGDGPWQVDPAARLSLEHQHYFSVLALKDPETDTTSSGSTVYATKDFTKLERLRGALGNILGTDTAVALMPHSLFNRITEQQQIQR